MREKWLEKSLSVCRISEFFHSFRGHSIGHSSESEIKLASISLESVPYLIQIQLNFQAACVKPRVRLNFKRKIRHKKEIKRKKGGMRDRDI